VKLPKIQFILKYLANSGNQSSTFQQPPYTYLQTPLEIQNNATDICLHKFLFELLLGSLRDN